MMEISLLQKLLDNAFSRAENPGGMRVDAKSVKRDLGKTGVTGLRTSEVQHIQTLLASANAEAQLSYDELALRLETDNFTFFDKAIIDEKLMQQQQKKERKSRAMVEALEPNHVELNDLEERLKSEAQRYLNRSDANANAAAADVLSGKADTGDDVLLAFAMITKLRSMLDKRRFRLIDAFNEMDTAEHGHVMKIDFGKGLTRLGVAVTRSQLDRVFDVFDLDNSGTIEFREFSRVMQSATVSCQKDKLARGSECEQKKNKARIEDYEEKHEDKAQVQANIEESKERNKDDAQYERSNEDQEEPDLEEKGKFMKRSKRYKRRTNSSKHICFRVSDRKYYLRKADVLTQPDSVLGELVLHHMAKLDCDNDVVFLDMSPDVFEVVVTRYFSGCAEAFVNGATTQQRRITEFVRKPGVNAHTISRMCLNLGLAPRLLDSEHKVLEVAVDADAKTSSRTSRNNDDAPKSKEGCCGDRCKAKSLLRSKKRNPICFSFNTCFS